MDLLYYACQISEWLFCNLESNALKVDERLRLVRERREANQKQLGIFLLWTCNLSQLKNKQRFITFFLVYLNCSPARARLAGERRAGQAVLRETPWGAKEEVGGAATKRGKEEDGGRGEAQTEAQRRKSEFMHEKNGDHCLVGEIAQSLYMLPVNSRDIIEKKSKTKLDGIFLHKFSCTLSTKLTKNKLLDWCFKCFIMGIKKHFYKLPKTLQNN